jgi:hypothetical protein
MKIIVAMSDYASFYESVDQPATDEEFERAVDQFSQNLAELSYLALPIRNGGKVLIPGDVLRNSVITFER